jgi:hypothetical protein
LRKVDGRQFGQHAFFFSGGSIYISEYPQGRHLFCLLALTFANMFSVRYSPIHSLCIRIRGKIASCYSPERTNLGICVMAVWNYILFLELPVAANFFFTF